MRFSVMTMLPSEGGGAPGQRGWNNFVGGGPAADEAMEADDGGMAGAELTELLERFEQTDAAAESEPPPPTGIGENP